MIYPRVHLRTIMYSPHLLEEKKNSKKLSLECFSQCCISREGATGGASLLWRLISFVSDNHSYFTNDIQNYFLSASWMFPGVAISHNILQISWTSFLFQVNRHLDPYSLVSVAIISLYLGVLDYNPVTSILLWRCSSRLVQFQTYELSFRISDQDTAIRGQCLGHCIIPPYY